jgi:lysophospholipase L1-like esterase
VPPSLLHQGTGAARVLLLGDSLAQGLGPPLARLADAAGVPFVARGVQSGTLRHWLTGSALLDAVTQADPTLTLVCLGTNDMRAADPGAEGRRALEMINALLLNGSAVAWIGPPSVPVDESAFRSALAAACGQRDVRIFDSQALDIERAPDRLHPTPAGYRAWAESIAAWLPLADLGSGPALATPSPPREAPVDTATTLGERAVVFALDEWRKGVREDSPGSNRSPRIDQYRRGMGTPGDPWCAWGFCYSAYAVLRPGESLPHAYTGSVAEIVRTGRFHARGDGYLPKRGDGAVWERDHENPTRGGKGHIGRVLEAPDATGRFVTLEGNSGDAWMQREHLLDEPHFLGWIEYAARSPARHLALRDPIFVAGLGELALDDYAARVVTAELGGSRHLEALKAQAIAARTYVQHALHSDPALGTEAKPVRNGQDFQVAAAVATALPRRAAKETRGGVAFYRGRLILANYVAGAPWAPGAWEGIASPKYPTEKYVTYNAGRVGASVFPTQQANPRHPDNRGTLSQNGADALAARGWTWPRILRFFYGDDLQVTLPEPADPAEPPRAPKAPPHAPKPSAPRKQDSSEGTLLLAAALTAYRIFG